MTEHAAPLDDAPEPRLVDGLARVALALRQHAWREANALGLSATQAQILAFLLRHARPPTKLAVVARDLGLTNATVSDAVRVLEAKGHVRKDRDPDDPRALALALTEAGRAAAERAVGAPDALVAAAATLPPDEQTALLRGLTKMIRALQEDGTLPAARLCVTCAHFRPHVHPDPERPHHCAFVDAPFGDRGLRLDCAEHEDAPPAHRRDAWDRWLDAT